MSTREWTHVDKATWGPGEWQSEPDKVQWVDEASGLDCLILRGPVGALCGYVGVPEGHPLYGIGYSQECPALADALERRKQEPVGETPGFGVLLALLGGPIEARPDIVFTVHGGITFSDDCHEPTEEQWMQVEAKANDPELLAGAQKYPVGDSAKRLASLLEQRGMTFSEWQEYQQARRICHVPEPGRPSKVWWFGFDCAHSGDKSPGMQRFSFDDGVYRNRAYVEHEIQAFALQLKAVAV